MQKRNTLGLALTGLLAVSAQSFAQTDFPQFPADNAFAAFIDTQNFATQKGASAEFRKLEGVAHNPRTNKLYFAVTEVSKGMADDKGDLRLKENVCGMVYSADLDGANNIAALVPVVMGGAYDKNNKDYPCDANAMANPDNIEVDPSGNLWIGEDTSKHKNQFLWMWDGTSLKRFASFPSGAEVTGLRILADGTLFLNVQHPNGTNAYPFNRGTIGIVTGYKAGASFTPVGVPTGDDTKRLIIASGEYQVLGRAGNNIPGTDQVFGQVTNADGSLVSTCNNPDGNMFLPTLTDNSEGYLYTNWECAPGGISKMYIRRNAQGQWASVEGENVDMKSVGGTQSNCNASVTPWGTALSGEEYPADVASEWPYWAETSDAFKKLLGAESKPNPYMYGYAIEVKPGGGDGVPLESQITKHYAMGRQSWEMALVLPDRKTVYSGNDGTDRIMTKFVADKEGDLSAGTIYAAKFIQDGEALNIQWIELGHGNDKDIKQAIDALGAAI